ncbi:hypothetical protein NYE67_20670 [Solibacillus sp. FSL W8-0474]|uniref:hypothetical protein n=1 Tax=Solibacillus sp. FSL W8-0474 TaxID=2975336 RepID=UPI0030F7C1D5
MGGAIIEERGKRLKPTKTIFNNQINPVNRTVKPTGTTERKKRSDAKRDIKVKLSEMEKKILQRLAMKRGIELTAMASEIVESQLMDLEQDFINYEYDENGKFVHVLLNEEYFEVIQNLSIEWDISIRKTAFKLIKNHITKVSGGFVIHDYRRNL